MTELLVQLFELSVTDFTSVMIAVYFSLFFLVSSISTVLVKTCASTSKLLEDFPVVTDFSLLQLLDSEFPRLHFIYSFFLLIPLYVGQKCCFLIGQYSHP